MAKILKNTTASPIVLADCGLTLPASSSYTSTPGEWYTLSTSTQIDSYITAETIVVNDGYDDLKPTNGLRHIHEESLDRPSAFIGTASIIATSNSVLTVDATSRLIYVFTGITVGQRIQFGDARTYNVGHKYEVWNSSTQEIAIQNGSGTPIFIIAVQQKTWVTLQDNSTQAGVWLIEANFMGTGSGGGNALMGFGFDGNGSTGRWLESLTNIASNLTGYIIAGNKTIRAISCAGVSGSTYTCTFTIYKNGVVLDTITLSASRKNTKLNLAYVLVDKDELSVQITSGACTRPVVALWV